MTLGLKNEPGTFQCSMDIILSTVDWQFTSVDLGDIVIFSKCLKAYIKHVRYIMTYVAMLAPLTNWRSANFSPILSCTWVIQFTLDNWQFHSARSTRSSTLSPQRTLRSYGRSWACETSFGVLYRNLHVLQHHWTENHRSTNWHISRNSPKTNYSPYKHCNRN